MSMSEDDVVRDAPEPTGHEADDEGIPHEPAPDLPPLVPELGSRVDALHHLPAPAFPTTGTALRSRLKRAANAALNLVGLSQRRFNETVAEALTLLMAETRGLRGWLEERAPLLPNAPDLAAALDGLRGAVEALRSGVTALRQDVGHLRERVAAGFEATRIVDRRQADLAGRVAELEGRGGSTEAERQARLDEVVRVLGQVGLEAQGLRATAQEHERWFRTLERKYEGLSLEARAIVEDRSAELPAPRVLDPESYARRLAAMSDGVRVNLGCGELAWPDYVNVDLRALPGVDVVADVRRLPFEPATVAELASAHLVEHFREHQLRTRVLPYWRSLLRGDGTLRIVCPNWAAMLERVQDGRMSLADFKTVTFGLQDYEGDDHFAMYTPDTLGNMLRECGFTRIEVLERDRLNGLCPEMELLARP
jgi:predicted SAM-dependent methyltransferase